MAVLKPRWLYALQRLSFSPWFPILLGVLAGSFVGLLVSLGALDAYECVLYDWRFSRRPEISPSRMVNVIYINDATLHHMAESLSRWPWSRSVWAAFQQEILDSVQPKTVVYDIVFDLPDLDPAADRAFASVIRNSGNVLLTSLFRDPRDGFISIAERRAYQQSWQPPPEAMQKQALRVYLAERRSEFRLFRDFMSTALPLPELLDGAWGTAATTYEPDPDGVLRRFPMLHRYADEIYPSLPLLAVAHYLDVPLSRISVVPGRHIRLPLASGEVIQIPIDRQGQMLVNFRSPDPGVIPSMNFAKCWEEYAEWQQENTLGEMQRLKNRLVVIGSVAVATEDIRGIPLDSTYPMTFAVATAMDNILKGDFLSETRFWDNLVIILLNALLVGVWSLKLQPSIRFALTFVQAYLYLQLNLWVFGKYNLCVPIVAPELAIAISFTLVLVSKYLFERNARRYAENLFGKYVDRAIVSDLVRHPEKIGLGGATKKVTILFTDLCGFTSVSEKMTSDQVVTMLNEYFGEMLNAVSACGGMVDKYVGDSVMVVFGLPEPGPHDALDAVHCALDMLERLEQRKNSANPGFFGKINMRTGINTGNVTAGNIGTERKQQYTVIGDSVNVACRLEALAPENGILISDSTFLEVKRQIAVKSLGIVPVKGKAEGVEVFEVIGRKAEITEQQ